MSLEDADSGYSMGALQCPLLVKKVYIVRWRQTEPDRDKLHLSDQWRVRLGIAVTRHFQGEKERFGVLG